MLATDAGDSSEGRTANDNAPVRTVFVIGPDKKIKLELSYPMSTGRNFDEILRVIDSLQLTAKHQVSTPADWKPGEDVIIGARSRTKKRTRGTPRYPGGWKTVRPYLRVVPQPK
jgi:thioredoxin-dependent peroxiredoxin